MGTNQKSDNVLDLEDPNRIGMTPPGGAGDLLPSKLLIKGSQGWSRAVKCREFRVTNESYTKHYTESSTTPQCAIRSS
jgi:hypothetical protein